MKSSVWILEKNRAYLSLGPLAATIDLACPGQGLVDVELGAGGECSSIAKLLGVQTPAPSRAEAPRLLERYVRGADLVATYGPSEAWPVQVDAVWRGATAGRPSAVLAELDAIVSVRTQLLDSRAELTVASLVPALEVLRLADVAATRWERLEPAPEAAAVLQPHEGPGCLLFRGPGDAASYAEMVHPADFRRDELSCPADSRGAVCVRHFLFPHPLEKGVILRARVRGVFVSRADDARTVAACFALFAAEEPPLGT